MRILFTGGAGFIGSHAVEHLLGLGHQVTVFDDLSTGKLKNLKNVLDHENLKFVQGDIKNRTSIEPHIEGQDLVYHFCDNSDIRFAASHPETYLNQNIYGLFYVLEAMRKYGVKKIIFPSSTTAFGQAVDVPVPENYGPMKPVNIYGGAKAAAEALISAWAHTYDLQAWIFRFVGIIGGRMDHGVTFDLIKKLNSNPSSLEILGDGSQQRSFMLVDDCVEAIWKSYNELSEAVNLVHIGNVNQISIKETAQIICKKLEFNDVEFKYTGGKVGWKGDVPSNYIKANTLDKMGWKPKYDSAAAVAEAAQRIQKGFL